MATDTTRTRVRGDDYPIHINFSVNDSPLDLTGSVLKFSYSNSDNTVQTILGTPTATLGQAEFIPNSGVDFMVEGVFTYDAQRVAGSYTYTHLKGTLIIEGDITP